MPGIDPQLWNDYNDVYQLQLKPCQLSHPPNIRLTKSAHPWELLSWLLLVVLITVLAENVITAQFGQKRDKLDIKK